MDFRCLEKDHHENNQVKDDGVSSFSHTEQENVEESILKHYSFFKNVLEVEDDIPVLHRNKHEPFLVKGLLHLSAGYECLDASRPWLCYWILHSMELLNIPIPEHVATGVAQFLGKCQHPKGGFAGGPGQESHLAPTYAAVNALCILATEEAYQVINRQTLRDYLMAMRTEDGAFKMHAGGEVDIRGAYCAVNAARLTNIATTEMFDGTPEWVGRCQTYEGGFGGCPDMEAHGGYSFCGLAALIMLAREDLCDLKALLRWTANKQMSYEGGFQGRTNKLVDGCYSFWQGGAFPLIHMVLTKETDDLSAEKWMFHQGALQEYLLICCQHPAGGLVDKPGKPRDFYHTCYCLSGLSVAQHFGEGKLDCPHVVGKAENELEPTHPLFNIGLGAARDAAQYFQALDVPSSTTSNSKQEHNQKDTQQPNDIKS